MLKTEAVFVGSYTELSKCPKPLMPEYAFIGRSNVGKSSLINLLLNHKGMAKISSRPGKTQTLNYFLVNKTWHIVDLPGIGYAKINKKVKEKWVEMIYRYLGKRECLMSVFYLIDSRLEPQKIDLEFINFLGDSQIPFNIVFTKADKISGSMLQHNVALLKRALKENWDELPLMFYTSCLERKAREEIIEWIVNTNQYFDASKISINNI